MVDVAQTGLRRYIALFVGGGPDLQDGIYFFGDSFMCDKMIEQRLRTSHGCLVLSDVSRVQLRQGGGSAGERAIALQTGAGKGTKEVVIVPEENFSSWARHVQVSRNLLSRSSAIDPIARFKDLVWVVLSQNKSSTQRYGAVVACSH